MEKAGGMLRDPYLLEGALNSLGEGVAVLNRDYTIAFINDFSLKLMKKRRREVLGRRCYEVFYQRREICLNCPARVALERGKAARAVHARTFRDGGIRWMELNAYPVYHKGEVVRVIETMKDVTELEERLRESERKYLRESEERYRDLVNNAPVGIYRSTLEGRMLMANSRLVEILGYRDEEELKAVNLQEHYVNPERRRELLKLLRDKGEVKDFEVKVRRKDGEHIFVNITARLLRDKEGNAYIEGVVDDVTERKKSRTRLAAIYKLGRSITSSLSLKSILTQAVERVSSMLDCPNCFILLLDEKGEKLECVAASENVSHVVGRLAIHMKEVSLAGETVKVRRPITVENAEESSVVSQKLRKRFGHRSLLSVPLIAKDKVLGVIILGETGRSRRFTAEEVELASTLASSVAVAIENARLYEEIERTRDFLNNILDSSADSIITTSLDGRITFFSRGAEELFGYRAEDMLGKSVLELYPEELRKERMKWVERLKKGETLRNIKTRVYNSKGDLVHINLSLSLLRDSNGKAIGTVGIAKDITAEVEARENLKEAYQRLRELDRLKDELIANVSHELRTPITIAKTAMELALEERDAEQRRRLLSMGINAMRRQDYIVGDLISFQEIRSRKYRLKMESIDVGHVALIVAEETKPKAMAKNVRMEVRAADGLPLVKADFNEVKHALRNLVDNAVKFNREGGRVLIEVKRKEGFLQVSVADTGIGIPRRYREKIFEKFYQIDSGPKRRYGGMGMGLAIVKSVVEAHGGRVWVESKPGRGSTFYFTLPLKDR